MNEGQCLEITNKIGCIKLDENLDCIQCNNDFFWDDNKCLEGYRYETKYCALMNYEVPESNIKERGSEECLSCVQNAFPFTFDDNYVCRNNDTIPTDSTTSNCSMYEPYTLGVKSIDYDCV